MKEVGGGRAQGDGGRGLCPGISLPPPPAAAGSEVTGALLHWQGDSGGPVMCSRGQVAGILSFSSEVCTDIFRPPVATAVAPYTSWIKKIIGH